MNFEQRGNNESVEQRDDQPSISPQHDIYLEADRVIHNAREIHSSNTREFANVQAELDNPEYGPLIADAFNNHMTPHGITLREYLDGFEERLDENQAALSSINNERLRMNRALPNPTRREMEEFRQFRTDAYSARQGPTFTQHLLRERMQPVIDSVIADYHTDQQLAQLDEYDEYLRNNERDDVTLAGSSTEELQTNQDREVEAGSTWTVNASRLNIRDINFNRVGSEQLSRNTDVVLSGNFYIQPINGVPTKMVEIEGTEGEYVALPYLDPTTPEEPRPGTQYVASNPAGPTPLS